MVPETVPRGIQSGEYCQGTLDVVDVEGVGVGLLHMSSSQEEMKENIENIQFYLFDFQV